MGNAKIKRMKIMCIINVMGLFVQKIFKTKIYHMKYFLFAIYGIQHNLHCTYMAVHKIVLAMLVHLHVQFFNQMPILQSIAITIISILPAPLNSTILSYFYPSGPILEKNF